MPVVRDEALHTRSPNGLTMRDGGTLTIFNRTKEKALALAEEFGKYFPTVTIKGYGLESFSDAYRETGSDHFLDHLPAICCWTITFTVTCVLMRWS